MELLYAFYYVESVVNTVKKLNLCRKIVIKYFKLFNLCLAKVIDEYYKNNKLGDLGIVEIDEIVASKKTKHNRENRTKEKCALAIRERVTGRFRFVDIGKYKTRKEIIPIIEETVFKGSQIDTDQYSVY